ncbi:MAG: hypothetical protein ACK4GW_08485 [Pseudorhodobacter sp.]
MKKLSVVAGLCAMLCLPDPGHAGTFTPPEGCTGWLTVQARSCRVSNYYKCDRDATGDQWRADFDQDGLFFASRIDAEAQWVESYDMNPMTRQTLDPGAPDPASFSELLSVGLDTFEFSLTKDNGVQSRVQGFDRLTGRTITIDGVALQETQFEFAETDLSDNIVRRTRGNEYVHPEWRLFFAGPSEWDGGSGDWLPMDGSPVQFIHPGEPGFFSTEPIYECDAVLSGFRPGDSVRRVVHVD